MPHCPREQTASVLLLKWILFKKAETADDLLTVVSVRISLTVHQFVVFWLAISDFSNLHWADTGQDGVQMTKSDIRAT